MAGRGLYARGQACCSVRRPLNAYGQPITPPEHFDGEHVANPMGAGLPPCCSCGWTPHGEFTMADHLADMKAT